jgi:hypothetical protein
VLKSGIVPITSAEYLFQVSQNGRVIQAAPEGDSVHISNADRSVAFATP